MANCLKVLVLAQYFSPDMGGGSTRATNVVKGLLSKGCGVTVVAAFPHYPHGKVSNEYRGKAGIYEILSYAPRHSVFFFCLVLHMSSNC